MEQNPIRLRKGSWGWLLIGAVMLTYLSALVAPSLRPMLYPSDIVALPPLYPDIFPHAPVMRIVGGLFIAIALLTMYPTKGGCWGGRIALVSIAAIMAVYVWSPARGIMSVWGGDLMPQTTWLLYLFYLWVLPLSLHHRIPDSMGKGIICVLRCILILITALMLLDHGPIFVLFIWLYWGSYRRIQSISSDKAKDVPVSDSIRYFSRMSVGSYGFALLMVVVWGWVILQHYPAHINAQKEYFLTRIWPLVLAFALVGIGLSLLVKKLSRYRRIQGLCVGFLFASIPAAWMLGLYLLSTMLSWYAHLPYNFTQWAVDPVRFLESYRYQTLALLDLLVASVAFPWVGALIGAVCSKKMDQT